MKLKLDLDTESAALETIKEEEIDREIAARRFSLDFAPPIETLYEAETGHARSRSLANRGLLGLLVYAPFVVLDYVLVPDVFALAVTVRFAVLVLGLVVYVILLQSPPRMVREGISGAICVVAGYSQLIIMSLSGSPDRDRLHIAVALIVVFVAVVQRLYLNFAVAVVLLLLIGHTTAVVLLPDFSLRSAIGLFVVSFGLAGLALFGSWSLTREIRLAYLVELKQRRANLALSEISLQDPLTALENRRALDIVVHDVAVRHAQEDLSAILMDLDHFKQFNDTLGHAAGDAALKRVADLLRSSLRSKSDHAVRIGGEEFLLLLPGTSFDQAMALAERLRQRLQDEAIVHPGSPVGVLTASLGVATIRTEGAEVVVKLMEAADAALYDAKRAGRNRVSHAKAADGS